MNTKRTSTFEVQVVDEPDCILQSGSSFFVGFDFLRRSAPKIEDVLWRRSFQINRLGNFLCFVQ